MRIIVNVLFNSIRKYPIAAYNIKLIILFAQAGRQEVQIDCHKAYPVSFAEFMSGKRKEVLIQQMVQIRMTTGNVNRPAVTRPCSLLFLIIGL